MRRLSKLEKVCRDVRRDALGDLGSKVGHVAVAVAVAVAIVVLRCGKHGDAPDRAC